MGFCLFEDWDHPGYYFAINPAHVRDYNFQDGEQAHCLMIFENPVLYQNEPIYFKACGSEGEISDILQQAARIGLTKSHLNILGNLSAKSMPLLINNADRIMAVKEIMPEKLFKAGSLVTTASITFFSDGTQRIIAERPGQFAFITNAGGVVPILKSEERRDV